MIKKYKNIHTVEPEAIWCVFVGLNLICIPVGKTHKSQVGYSGINVTGGGGGGGGCIFLGLKFSTPVFFWVEDLTVYFFGSEKSARIFLSLHFRQANSSYAI